MSAASPGHKVLFQFVGRFLAFLPNYNQASGLRKPSFLQCGLVLALRLSVAVPLVSHPMFIPNFLVRFVTSEASLAFVATNALFLVVNVAIAYINCSNTTFSVVAFEARLSK